MPPRAFFDANVVFSAVLSSRGVPRELLLLAARDAIQVVISQQIVEEIKRNLSKKYPELLDLFPSLLTEAGIEVIEDASQCTVEEVIEYVPYPPDAAVLAAALEAQVDCFVTGDKKHFLSKPQIEDQAGLSILSPRQFSQRLAQGS
ncbi:MAG: putative toxin-antitoxin system toxin component, PIN family [Anaerolineae bacterium]|nr:putative toxin-antitoxin system toxin component, PIN family [Anaerolineae bacterium]